MSATNRGSARIEHDVYSTPSWCTRRILEALNVEYMRGLSLIEPCAGDGAIIRELRRLGVTGPITANDVRPTNEAMHAAGATFTVCSDYRLWPEISEPLTRYDIGITNPPYALAESITRTMLLHCSYVIVLVRQGFMSSAKRAAWLRSDMPDTYELPNRPSFARSITCKSLENATADRKAGCGWHFMQDTKDRPPTACPQCNDVILQVTTSDATDYCWLVWTPERGRTWGRRFILPETSREERARG